MAGATIFSLVWTAALGLAAAEQWRGLLWLASMSVLFWLGAFMIALPSAGIVFSVFWPVIRRRTAAANCICVLSGATMGLILAPMASSDGRGASLLQLAIFAALGATIAGSYLVIVNRLGRKAGVVVDPAIFSD